MDQLTPSAWDQDCQEALDGAGRSCTRHILIHVHEILLVGVQQSLWAEVKEAEDLAKGHQLAGLPLLQSSQAPSSSSQSLSPATAAPARALQPQHYFIQHTTKPSPNKSHLANQYEI